MPLGDVSVLALEDEEGDGEDVELELFSVEYEESGVLVIDGPRERSDGEEGPDLLSRLESFLLEHQELLVRE